MAFSIHILSWAVLFMFCGTGGGADATNSCPCEDVSLCKTLQIPPRREVLAFAVHPKENYHLYDWTRLTTLAVFGKWDSKFYCHAHSKNVRVVLSSFIPIDQLLNDTFKVQWVQAELDRVSSVFADGINIDTESPVPKDSPQERALTEWTRYAVEEFHHKIPGSQVTFDVAWSPDGIDGRFYDYLKIAELTDFVIVMSYDEQSQIFGKECIAMANSGIHKTHEGIQKYLDLGVKKEKLVIGLPWYGYNYPCVDLTGNKCTLKHVPFRGVNCSDAAGKQYGYTNIKNEFIPQAIGGVQFDEDSQSPFFNYKDKDDGQMHQIWFDDPKSLSTKYDMILSDLGLRGLAMWNVDSACTERDMWQALPVVN